MTTQTLDLRAAVVEALAEDQHTRAGCICGGWPCKSNVNVLVGLQEAGLAADALATSPAVRTALTAAIASAGDGETALWRYYSAAKARDAVLGTPEAVAAAVLGALGGTGVAG